ncbi:MAG: 1-deoxy-D-xylulose-5-phosphate reductoisomerase, partial [Planctomycetota bacterium]
PIDSEHSAIFQCLAESRALTTAQPQQIGRTATTPSQNDQVATPLSSPNDNGISERGHPSETGNQTLNGLNPPSTPWPNVRKIILTASGGPFRDWSQDQMHQATPQQALAHPTWTMGDKISIDSATMMNKALEIIEAKWLFDLSADQIEVVVHPQSLIHSMVEFNDGSVVAQVSPPDMKLPIQYALTYPRRLPCPCPTLGRDRAWDLSLLPADPDRFPALELGFEVARAGGTAGVVINGANETAVDLFLNGQIRFTDIPKLCRQTLMDHHHESSPDLPTLLKLDRWSRQRANQLATMQA